jgi:hypothetical protein
MSFECCAADSHLPRDLPPGRAVHLMDSSFVARDMAARQHELLLFNKFLAERPQAFSGGALWQKCE